MTDTYRAIFTEDFGKGLTVGSSDENFYHCLFEYVKNVDENLYLLLSKKEHICFNFHRDKIFLNKLKQLLFNFISYSIDNYQGTTHPFYKRKGIYKILDKELSLNLRWREDMNIYGLDTFYNIVNHALENELNLYINFWNSDEKNIRSFSIPDFPTTP